MTTILPKQMQKFADNDYARVRVELDSSDLLNIAYISYVRKLYSPKTLKPDVNSTIRLALQLAAEQVRKAVDGPSYVYKRKGDQPVVSTRPSRQQPRVVAQVKEAEAEKKSKEIKEMDREQEIVQIISMLHDANVLTTTPIPMVEYPVYEKINDNLVAIKLKRVQRALLDADNVISQFIGCTKETAFDILDRMADAQEADRLAEEARADRLKRKLSSTATDIVADAMKE
jgi:hypothetical protein